MSPDLEQIKWREKANIVYFEREWLALHPTLSVLGKNQGYIGWNIDPPQKKAFKKVKSIILL